MANFYDDNLDMKFYDEKGIDWEPIVAAAERDFKSKDGFKTVEEAKEFYSEVLNMIGSFVAEQIAPHAANIDRDHSELVDGEVQMPQAMTDIFEQMGELGLHSLGQPREIGGMNTPILVYMLAGELIARGDVSIMTHFGFHGGVALILLMYSILEGTTEFDRDTFEIKNTRFIEAIREIMSGKEWGCMDITEPHAGSDMAALRTKAELDENGTWLISGEKCFITSGNAKYHLVIARSEIQDDQSDAFAGLNGLSLFLVPAWEETPSGRRRTVKVDRIEEKIGHRASPTCTILFEKSPGYLIGGRGDGFRLMLKLMNNARLSVGFESLGLSEAAYRMSKEYASQRFSMGKTIDKHEMIAEYLETMETEIQAIRAICVEAAYHNELEVFAEFRVKALEGTDSPDLKRYQAIRKKHGKIARRYTPLLKFFAAEKAVEHGRMAMQIHGGSGYTNEYGAEKLLRDSLVLPIYEGTTQIQALMATKDTLLQITKNPQDLVKGAAEARWRSISVRDPLERKVAKIQALCFGAQQSLISRVASGKIRALNGVPLSEWKSKFLNWDPKADFAPALLHAERLTHILTDVAICEILLKQARKFPERRDLLERFVERALPRAQYNAEVISTTGARLLDKLHGSVLEKESVPVDKAS